MRNNMIGRILVGAGLVAAMAGVAGYAWGFINPSFSPVEMVAQSDMVLQVKLDKPGDDGKVKATITKVMKGEKAPKEITIDLGAGPIEESKMLTAMLKGGGTEGLLFVGAFQEGGDTMGMPPVQAGPAAMLHTSGFWLKLKSTGENKWDSVGIDDRMRGTWAGSTDMLIRAVEYVMSDENAVVPTAVGVDWDTSSVIGHVAGTISSVQAIDPDGDGKLAVFVASDAGDKIFKWEGKAFADVTGKYKVASKSKLAKWVNGKVLSWDGKSLKLGDKEIATAAALKNGCTSLAVMQIDKATTAFVIGTKASPEIVIEGQAPTTVATDVEALVKDLGEGSECLVADFDGDGQPDILQLFEHGGLFYKGLGGGKFAAPAATRICFGVGKHGLTVGDFDQGGHLDVYTTAEDANRMWQNVGGGQFVDKYSESGELWYIAKPHGNGAAAGDVNNDGRQDLLMEYGAAAPQIFFNRGFRSTGHARELDAGEINPASDITKGTQAGCLADFNGDGAQDMVIALNNGKVWFYPRAVTGQALCVTVEVAPGTPGPVLVKGWNGKRALGAWSVGSGETPAFFGLQEAGRITIKWTIPGGQEQTKELVVVDKPVRFVIGAEK